jgi:hypothetical protein
MLRLSAKSKAQRGRGTEDGEQGAGSRERRARRTENRRQKSAGGGRAPGYFFFH